MTQQLVLLRHGNLGIIIEACHTEGTDDSHEEYFYNEHTCPCNWIDDIIAIIDLNNGDIDPHGIAQYVGRLPLPNNYKDLSGDAIAEFVYERFKTKTSPSQEPLDDKRTEDFHKNQKP
jgi:hypothetical protein